MYCVKVASIEHNIFKHVFISRNNKLVSLVDFHFKYIFAFVIFFYKTSELELFKQHSLKFPLIL